MFATANAAGPQGVDTTSTTEGVGSSPIISSTKDIYAILRLLMLKSVRPEALVDNPFKMIGKDWMLVTACTRKIDEDGNVINGRANTMTASWGGVGILWNKPVATIYTAINGSRNILEFAKNKRLEGMVYLSSLEIYGVNEKDNINNHDRSGSSADRLFLEYRKLFGRF